MKNKEAGNLIATAISGVVQDIDQEDTQRMRGRGFRNARALALEQAPSVQLNFRIERTRYAKLKMEAALKAKTIQEFMSDILEEKGI